MEIFHRQNKVKQPQVLKMIGFTIVELIIAVAIVGVILTVAVPSYQNYKDRMSKDDAIKDLTIIQFAIDDYELTHGVLPNTLADIGMDGMEDPWGNPYVYANHGVVPPGHRRKDHSLVPINSDYDLYSMGEDGSSVPPLTATASKDDIVRGRDGGFIGEATDY